MVAHLDYAHDSPERVTSIRVISTSSLQKLLAQLNMDCLLDKEYNNGSRTHRDKSFFDLWWRSSWAPSEAWCGRSSSCRSSAAN